MKPKPLLFDEHRAWMREQGWVVCQLRCCRETHRIVTVVYRYAGDDLIQVSDARDEGASSTLVCRAPGDGERG